MRVSHAAVVWMFERLGLDVALAGDLMEECARGLDDLVLETGTDCHLGPYLGSYFPS